MAVAGAGTTRLRLVFTQIDPASPQREFFFSVNVDEQDQYEVAECSPAVPADRLDALVRTLNAKNDFSCFVKAMRREFKAMVTTSAAPAVGPN